VKINEVYPGLFIRGRSDLLPYEDKAATVHSRGIRLVVNLWLHPDEELWALVPAYWLMPIPDGPKWVVHAPRLERTATRIAANLVNGHPVLVQCHAGRNRSAFLAALAIRAATGCDGATALAKVRAARPGAVAQPAFVSYLEGLS
jgi:hypothetical protein